MTSEMKGKVCVVTGANSGIGKATAAGLASMGAQVILACRDLAKGEAAISDVRAVSSSESLQLMKLDLASLSSIRDFAAAVEARFDRVDVLINNAGTVARTRQLTEDGFELQFGVNHLGHFALTRRLQPLLERSAPARVIVVSSELHKAGAIAWDDLRSDRGYRMMRAYAQSKLANMLFVHEFAKRAAGIRVNALHPGAAATEIMRDAPRFSRILNNLLGTSATRAASTSLYLASSSEGEMASGGYFKNSRRCVAARAALDDRESLRLWEASEELTNS